MKRVKERVSLEEARRRLEAYRQEHGDGPHGAAQLGYIIWPDAEFIRSQGAGAAATRVLKKLGCHWYVKGDNWGWMIHFDAGEQCTKCYR